MNTKNLLRSMITAQALLLAAPAIAEGTNLGYGLTLSGDITVINDYRFRGYTQTNFKPAAQLGIELSHDSGFYIGNWNSNVGWLQNTSIEMDVYAGWRKDIKGFELDLGVLQYFYPGAGAAEENGVTPNTTELYVGVSKGPFGLTINYTPTNWFGFENSKNAWYFDGSANFDLGNGWGIGLHVGYQILNNVQNANGNNVNGFFDYKAGISKDISGWVLDLSVVGASTDNLFLSSQGHPAGRVGALFSIAKSF